MSDDIRGWSALMRGHYKVYKATGCRKALYRAKCAAEIVSQLITEQS